MGFVKNRLMMVMAACGALGATACSDVGTPTDAAARQPLGARTGADQVSYALALGMQDAGVRADVLAALRESVLSEHKLVLQEFATSERGGRVVAAAARAAGMDAEALGASIARLPEMDFYAPFVEHRAGWTGNADVVVAFAPDPDAPQVTGYTPRGEARTYFAGKAAPAEAMLMLHPAERKEQVLAAPRRSGATIEAFNEASLAMTPVGGTADQVGWGTTYLYQFRFNDSDGWGDAEVEFTACYHSSWDSYGRSMAMDLPCFYSEPGATPGFYRKTGVVKSRLYTPNFALLNARAGFNGYIVVECWEDDAANDDYYGFTTLGHTASYGTWTAGGTMRTYGDPNSWAQRSSNRCEMLFN
jgi:hypothetical protein